MSLHVESLQENSEGSVKSEMKNFLGMLLGESSGAQYDPAKYSCRPSPAAKPSEVYGARAQVSAPPESVVQFSKPAPRTQPPPPPPARRQAPAPVPSNQVLYGSSGGNDLQHNANAQQEASNLGCWLVSQPGVAWPVRQELKADTLPLQARAQIAAASAAPLGNGAAALYDNDTFMSPLAASQPVIATGSLINTYTGEVVDLFEDAMPPPDNGRDAGDAERERKQAQRRLLAAEGNVNASHHKREQQNPIQPGDAGAITQAANFQVSQDVATEWNERANRDLFFNRKELAPTELEMTRNPFGFEGYNNRLRITPYLLPTQDLDDKNWTPNATLLPGGDHRPKNVKPRMKKERPRTDYAGQVSTQVPGETQTPGVRRSAAARDREGLAQPGRGVDASQALYGDARAVDSAAQKSPKAQRGVKGEAAPHYGFQSASGEAFSAVTAASVLSSLGFRGVSGEAQPLLGSSPPLDSSAAVASAQHRASERREALQAAPTLATLGLGADLVQTHAQDRRAPVEAAALPLGQAADERGAAFSMAQRQELGSRDARASRSPASAQPSLQGAKVDSAQLTQRRAPELQGLRAGQPLGGVEPSLQGAKVESGQLTQRRAPELQEFRAGVHEPAEGVSAAAASGVLEGRECRKEALERRGQSQALEARDAAAGAHGAFGQLSFKARSERSFLAERPALAHDDRGFSERNSAVSTSNARGSTLSSRQDNFRVGGDTDYQRRAQPGQRETRPELQTSPYVAASSTTAGQRSLLGAAREARRPRPAKSPLKAHRLRERSGLSSQLQEPLESRYEDEGD